MSELTIWRTLSRHPDLERSLAGMAELLAAELPLAGLAVQRFDREARRAVIVADDWTRDAGERLTSLPAWDQIAVELFLGWHREGRVARGRAGKEGILRLLWPTTRARAAIAAPLLDDEHHPGVLLLFAAPGAFTAAHEERAREWIEPFSRALATDRSFHELSRLHETLEAERRALLTRLDRQEIVETIVGADAGLAAVMEQVNRVAPTIAPVLIFGDTGTGKEVVARAIHTRSRRHEGPMVRVNCGAIPPGLVDSELFGHERGSFTGAVAARSGWFERADGGTLFLDEIGELPLEAQVRLLRVLQEGVLERVGGTRPIHVDVRIVAATNRDLEQMVSRGEFRQDLWYRLLVFPIRLPALRERRHDIPDLAAHFSARAGRRLGGGALVPSAEDIELLLAYDWPGNIRELAAVIERAAILGDGRRLDIPCALGNRGPANLASPRPRRERAPSRSFPTLDERMRQHIEEALALAGGRIEGERGAARLLAVNPHTLRSRMRKLGIDWARFRENGGDEGR